MKKYILIGLIVISVIAVITIGIKETTPSPSETTTAYLTAIAECRYEEVFQYLSYSALSEIEEDIREEGATLEELIKEADRECKREMEEEGVTFQDFRIEILSEEPLTLTPEEEKGVKTKWNLKEGEKIEIVEVKYEGFFAGDSRKGSAYLVKEFGAWKILG